MIGKDPSDANWLRQQRSGSSWLAHHFVSGKWLTDARFYIKRQMNLGPFDHYLFFNIVIGHSTEHSTPSRTMFPASFYQQLPVYRAPSPDHHRQAQPFTIASSDSYDLFCTPSPQAYATAEASALEHLHRQAALEALRARERELEKQRRLARLAALEEAQHREYHQQQVINAYLQAQARARAQQEAERLQRERQRQYQERAAAIARAQAIQRERAERARAAEIERRREEARQRIFVRDLMDS